MAHKITNNQSFILISGGGLVCLSKYRKEFMGVATICILLCRERKTNCVKVCIRDDFGITKNPEIVP